MTARPFPAGKYDDRKASFYGYSLVRDPQTLATVQSAEPTLLFKRYIRQATLPTQFNQQFTELPIAGQTTDNIRTVFRIPLDSRTETLSSENFLDWRGHRYSIVALNPVPADMEIEVVTLSDRTPAISQ